MSSPIGEDAEAAWRDFQARSSKNREFRTRSSKKREFQTRFSKKREFQTITIHGVSESNQNALGESSKSSARFVLGPRKKLLTSECRRTSELIRNELEAACNSPAESVWGPLSEDCISRRIPTDLTSYMRLVEWEAVQARHVENAFAASSKSSGSESKEPKLALAKASASSAKKAAKFNPGAKKADPSKKVETDYSNSMSSDGEWIPDEFPNSIQPRPRLFIHGGPGVLCDICNGKHQYCPFRRSVPPGVHINDSYFRCCRKCGYPVDQFDFEEESGCFYCKCCDLRVLAFADRKWW